MMLRDFEVAHRVIDQCRQDGIGAEFWVVIPEVGKHYFTGCTNARIISNMSEVELIRLYQSSDALFLPLIHSTANNAILEALACGLPVVSTRIGGVPDYVDETCGWLVPPADFESAYECVRSIVRNRDSAWQKRVPARLRAEIFSWEGVTATLRDAYARLRRSGRFAPVIFVQ
jgi:glycosyltransferase involved in cell wall biosynthesis